MTVMPKTRAGASVTRAFSGLIYFALLCVTVLCMVRWAIRTADAFLLHEAMDGGEGPFIYNVWKIVNGHPLYNNPLTGAATALPLYNFLSYYLYAVCLKALHITDFRIVPYGKVITGLLCVAGSVVSGLIACRALALRRPGSRALAYLCGFYAWFAPLPFGPYNLMIRADMTAALFVALALLFTVTGMRQSSARSFLFAGIFFYIAWCAKQTAVSALAATVFYLSLRTWRWKPAMLIAAPFVVLSALTICLGGPVYRLCTLVAATFYPFDMVGLKRVVPLTVSIVPLIMLSPFAYLALRRKWLAHWKPPYPMGSRSDSLHLFFHIVVLNLLFSIPETAHAGGTANYLIESALAATPMLTWLLLLTPRFAARLASPLPRLALLSAVLLGFLATGIYPLASICQQIVQGKGLWMSAKAVDSLRAAEGWIQQQPEPVLILDERLGLPWISSGGSFPAFEYDRCAHFSIEGAHRYHDGGPDWVVSQRLPATVLIDNSDIAGQEAPLYRAALSANYADSKELFRFEGREYRVFRRQ
jgi:hypothetical protein